MLGLGNIIPSSDAAIETFEVPTRSLALDGAGDYATFDATAFAIYGSGSNLSIVFWAKRTDNNDIALVLGSSAAFATKRLNFGADGTTLEIEGDQDGQSASGDVTADTNWHHYAITIEGTGGSTPATVIMYEDGEDISATNTNLGVTADKEFTIDQMGATVSPGSNTHEFKGLLSQVAIFNNVLKPTEVTQIYNGGGLIPLEANEGEYYSSLSLIHLWKFATTADTIGALDLTYVGDAAASSTIPS